MKTIILIRHTENSKDSVNSYSSFDGPLTDDGKFQAKEIAKYLTKYKEIDAIFTSILLRSQETGKIIGENLNKPVFHTSAFNEYYVRTDKTEVESTGMGIARVMTKIY